jgi:hypothetical protein
MPLRREHARIALATIRLVNGALALLAPEVMLRRLGADPRTNGVAVYPLRMFGIRTVVSAWSFSLAAPRSSRARSASSSTLRTPRRRSPGCGGNCPRGRRRGGRNLLTNTALALTMARKA